MDFNMIDILPNNPSKLIRVAISDLEIIEKDLKYEINMDVWHNPGSLPNLNCKKKCQVCLAGAVMANTLKQNIKYFKSPIDFGSTIEAKLTALDWFRVGSIEDGIFDLEYAEVIKRNGITDDQLKELSNIDIVPYENDKEKFKISILKLADKFEEFGY